MEFRKDINGLRAFAVMAVVFYHFGLRDGTTGVVTGGFAGVDVFFVISGYLMTGIILSKLWQGRFSLIDFYLGRARRIIPALAVLCLALLGAGYFWLIPSDYKTLGEHAAAAITFVSNFVFKGEEGYFDAPMRDKWMLHTWSLSVEWQFYLLYPLFLMGINKFFKPGNGKLMVILAALALLSLTASIFLSPVKSSFAFYLLPTRIWEFMAGALVFIISQSANPPFKGSARTALAGMALMMVSFFIFSSENSWPGAAALLPVMGSALVILAAHENSFLTGNAAAQWLGKASYSIYLWHWPVFVGLSYFGLTSNTWALGGILLSLLLGAASYVLVEIPTRKKMAYWPKKVSIRYAAIAIVLIGGAGLSLYTADGLPARVPPQIRSIDSVASTGDRAAMGCGFNKKSKTLKRCFTGDEKDIRFAIWGDSHAGAIADAVATAAGGGGVTYVFSCPTIFNARLKSKEKKQGCEEFNDLVFADIKTLPENVPVIIANRFSSYLHGANEGVKKNVGLHYTDMPDEEVRKDEAGIFKNKLTKSLCTIAMERQPPYVVLPIAEMGQDVPKTMARRLMAGRAAPEISVSRKDYAARHKDVLDALYAAHESCDVVLLDPVPYLCDRSSCSSTFKGQPLYSDDDHLNDLGRQSLVHMFREMFSE